MAIQCMKCGYVRKEAETAPSTECPKCGAIYAKVAASLVEKRVLADSPRFKPSAHETRPGAVPISFERAADSSDEEESFLATRLLGKPAEDRSLSIIALSCGGFTLLLPYIAVIFFAPIGVIVGLVAMHKRQFISGFVAAAMSAGGLTLQLREMNKATDNLKEQAERIQRMMPQR